MPIVLSAFIAEDSAVIREGLIGALEELAPIEVVGTAEDEQSAVNWLADHHCDVVVVDVFLKSGSGLGILRFARTLRRDMKCVVLTNYATPQMRGKCLELGAARVFDKSSEIEELIIYCEQLSA